MTETGTTSTRERSFIVASSLLIISYFTLAPLVPRSITGLAGIIALFAAVVGWHGLRRLPPASRALFAAFVFYVIMALVSLLHNENWHAAGERFEKYHPFLFAIPLLGWLALLRDRLPTLLLLGMSGAAVTITAVALYEKLVLHAERAGYLTGLEPNVFGHVSSMVALVLLGHALFSRQRYALRALLLALALGALFGLIATGTRGAVAAFLVGFVTLISIGLLRNGVSRNTMLTLGAVTGILLLLLSVAFIYSDFWRAHWQRLVEEPGRFLAGDMTYSSTAARATMWISGWKTGLANFWIGTGIGDNQVDYDRLMAAGELPPIPGNSNFHLHNIFVDAFASTGIIGLLSQLLAIFIVPLRYFLGGLRGGNTSATESVAATIGISLLANGFVFGLSFSWLYVRDLHFFLLLLLLLLVLAHRPRLLPQE